MPALSRFLRYFVAVGRSGSIRRAADELHVSASAIDRQILAAEQELGTALFERLPTGLRLTSAGELMMASAVGWQKSLADVRTHIEDLRGLRRGHVAIGLIDALAKGAVPQLVSRVRADYPGITIALRVLDNEAVSAAIRAGSVDFGIMLDPRLSRDFAVRAHVDATLGFVTRPDHPLAGSDRPRFAAATEYPLVMPLRPLALAEQVAVLAGLCNVVIRPVSTSDNIQMIKSLVREDVGVGILTSLDVINEVAAGELAFRPIADAVARPLTLALCVASPRQLSSAANLVLRRNRSRFSATWADRLKLVPWGSASPLDSEGYPPVGRLRSGIRGLDPLARRGWKLLSIKGNLRGGTV